ncbi:hypothetical protein [Flammeovirga agarivorans]|uniref:Lipoprotein n=1 Tax=Flammeovirga agarivorans TaxID=2726742 RepID=A0A7X8XW50_9BACT|nr:hypothetical protein [Flammeovirga agarivorans]NLR91745.1 hypothetical protein [Flammeovirga agarivorans]
MQKKMKVEFGCIYFLLTMIGFSCIESPNNSEVLKHCDEVTLAQNDTIKRKLIRTTINEFVQNDLFVNNKGIIEISIYPDTLGGEKWYISAQIEDNYKRRNDITSTIEDFYGDIILYYYEDYTSQLKRKNRSESDKNKIRDCLEYAIGDRVYQKPTKKKRWSRLKIGERELGGINRGITGWSATKTVLFNWKGEYTLLNRSYGCYE